MEPTATPDPLTATLAELDRVHRAWQDANRRSADAARARFLVAARARELGATYPQIAAVLGVSDVQALRVARIGAALLHPPTNEGNPA